MLGADYEVRRNLFGMLFLQLIPVGYVLWTGNLDENDWKMTWLDIFWKIAGEALGVENWPFSTTESLQIVTVHVDCAIIEDEKRNNEKYVWI